MAGRRFTLAGLLLSITLIGLILAVVAPLYQQWENAASFADQVAAVAMSADGSTAAALTRDGTVRVWDVEHGTLRATLPTGGGLRGPLVVSSNGKWAALPSASMSAVRDEIEIWDVASRNRKRTLPASSFPGRLLFSPAPNAIIIENAGALVLHSLDASADRLRAVAKTAPAAFSPDGRTIALGEPDGIHFYDTTSLARRDEFFASGRAVVCLAFSPDGQTLAVLEETLGPRSGKRQLKVWDLSTRASRQVSVEPAGRHELNTVTYLPGGRAIAVPEGIGLSIIDGATLEPLDHEKIFTRLAAGLGGGCFLVSDGAAVDLHDAQTLERHKRLLDPNPEPALMPVLGLAIWAFCFMRWRSRKLMRVCP